MTDLDHKVATTDFEQFYLAWEPKVRVALFQAGFFGPDADELLQDIFLALLQGQYLEKYDPTIGSFSNYIWTQVRVRIWDRRRVFGKRGEKEMVVDPKDWIAGTSQDTGKYEEVLRIEYKQAIRAVYQELKTLPKTDTRNLAKLFAKIVEQVEVNGYVNRAELAKDLGISHQGVSIQIRSIVHSKAGKMLYEILSKMDLEESDESISG